MGMLVIARRKGESVQISNIFGQKAILEVIDIFADVAMIKLHMGEVSRSVEIPYAVEQKALGGTVSISRHIWRGRESIEQIKIAFDLPRSVKILRSELTQ